MCCTDDFGCGVTKPNWIDESNGTYMGRANFNSHFPGLYQGQADQWLAKGLQINYYWATPTGVPLALVQGTDDYQYFDPRTFSAGPQPSGLYDLPSYCDVNNKCTGFCQFGR